jgi:signal transduction histidine kinase/ActR/RegA family two-component response regulator
MKNFNSMTLYTKTVDLIKAIGTEGVEDEEIKKNIRLTNIIGSTILLLIFIVGGTFILLIKQAMLTIPAIIEFVTAAGVILLNARKKHVAASVLLFVLQCVAVLYFTLLFGDVLQLGSMIIFLMSIIYLIIRDNKIRKWCLLLAISTFVAIEVCHALALVTPLQLDKNLTLVLRTMANGGILVLVIVISRPYISSNDKNYILEQANHFKSVFVAQIVHEQRNYLNAMRYVLLGLKESANAKEPGREIASMTAHLDVCVENMSGVCNNVLSMAELEAGKPEQVVEEGLFTRIFFIDLIDLHRLTALGRKIKIDLNIASSVPQVICSDSLILSQIMTNLISNAIKYSSTDSVINVKVEYTTGELGIIISNSCKDISLDKQKVLFDLFVTSKADSRIEGTGLGLYIVAKKVAAMGGAIALSSLGGTTRFELAIPVKEGNIDDIAHKEKGRHIDLKDIRILIADDNLMCLRLLSYFLALKGAIIQECSDGLEVLEALKGETLPDVIILDNEMPQLKGEQILGSLSSDIRTKNIPVIMATGNCNAKLQESIITAGAVAVLPKPIDHTVLLMLMGKHLYRRSLITEMY